MMRWGDDDGNDDVDNEEMFVLLGYITNNKIFTRVYCYTTPFWKDTLLYPKCILSKQKKRKNRISKRNGIHHTVRFMKRRGIRLCLNVMDLRYIRFKHWTYCYHHVQSLMVVLFLRPNGLLAQESMKLANFIALSCSFYRFTCGNKGKGEISFSFYLQNNKMKLDLRQFIRILNRYYFFFFF